jgi:thioredoxin reductase (NADPH)
MLESLNFDVIVVGSGPAGITAAIYLKRANFKVMMIDSNAPGGQLNRISMIENFPGFSKIAGSDLAYNMFVQTQGLGIPYKYGKVVEIIAEQENKIVKTENEEYTCKAVILATGRKPKELGLSNEKSLIGRGISWCAICDGALFKDKNVIVVGGGNSALEESLYLSGIANKVTIVHHSNKFTADDILQKQVSSDPKIEVYLNNRIVKLNQTQNNLDSVEIMNNTAETNIIKASGIFVYVGFEPSIEYIKNIKIDTNNGYIVVDENMKTNVDGIYACGDVIDKTLYQITTAVAEGSLAAMSVIKDLQNN